MSFKLNPILEQDSIFIDKLELCELRLMNNSDFPWVILVPQIEGIVEIIDLKPSDYAKLNAEIFQIAKMMKVTFSPDKLNIANIGNIVPQLHVHIIARFKNDRLFPRPVWGNPYNHYNLAEAGKIIDTIKKTLK